MEINQYDENGLRHGLWVRHKPDGNVSTSREYRHGERDGSCLAYWANNIICYIGQYTNGKISGYWERNDPNGNMREIVYYIC